MTCIAPPFPVQEEEEGAKEEEGKENRGSEAQDGEGMYNIVTTRTKTGHSASVEWCTLAKVYMASKDTPQAMEKLAWNWSCLAASKAAGQNPEWKAPYNNQRRN